MQKKKQPNFKDGLAEILLKNFEQDNFGNYIVKDTNLIGTFFYQEKGVSDKAVFISESYNSKIDIKLRTYFDTNINKNVLVRIDGIEYEVINTFNFEDETGNKLMDISLKVYGD